MVLEAPGEQEAEAGIPVVGKAGMYLWQQLQRVGLDREGFRVANTLCCRPPANKLAKMPYENLVIESCSPLLDMEIKDFRAKTERMGKTMVILTLGRIPFKRIMGLSDRSPILKYDYYAYPFWNPTYNCWVVAAMHPSYLMRGNNHEVPILQFAAKRAVEIAEKGLTLASPSYLLDPSPTEFYSWAKDYFRYVEKNPSTTLSYDIETPYKQKMDEADLTKGEEEGDDYTIIRCGFSYIPNEAVSIPWQPEYSTVLEDLFTFKSPKVGWNSENYDLPRVRNQMAVNGDHIDAMLAWHVLNSALPKGLGFVTPFYAQNVPMWKHLSGDQPAFYNAKDADMALRCWLGIRDDLKVNNLWNVFDRHVIQLNRALTYMSEQGLNRDDEMRSTLEVDLTSRLKTIDFEIDSVIPFSARRLQVYKKTPKSLDNLVQVEGKRKASICPICSKIDVKTDHFKSIGKKRLKAGELENPCHGVKSTKTEIIDLLWAKPLEWRISKMGLLDYQSALRQTPIKDRDGKITFDENALKRLVVKYPNDPLYPKIGTQRYLTKLRGTYVGVTQPSGAIKGGMPMGRDGKGHPQFTHNPSTLRLACPFFHTLPRPGKPDEPHTGIRNMIMAAPGNIFVARDFSGIEAVLVGYEAKSARYIRLAKMDVHSFYSAHALYAIEGRISANDLPDLSWPDERLRPALAAIKKEFKEERNGLYKHLVHAINFGQGPKGAQEKIYRETEKLFDISLISKAMKVYKEDLFPEIPKWHNTIRLQAEDDGYLRNAFGYIHRFNRVFKWENDDYTGVWRKALGDDAEAVLAFRPQSNAAGMIKEAILRLFYNRFKEAGQYLRLQVHDEIFMECPEDRVDVVDNAMQEEMERPVPEMPLPQSWNMGSHLVVLSESKKGYRWGMMK